MFIYNIYTYIFNIYCIYIYIYIHIYSLFNSLYMQFNIISVSDRYNGFDLRSRTDSKFIGELSRRFHRPRYPCMVVSVDVVIHGVFIQVNNTVNFLFLFI